MTGSLVLAGGGGWIGGAGFDAAMAEAADAGEVVVLPTAAAYEHPGRVVEELGERLAGAGVGVVSLDVLQRRDAMDEERASLVRRARALYLADGSALHLRSVLKDSPVLDAVRAAWNDGAALIGSGAAATALCDPMVDPRGGAFTVGLGLVVGVAVLPATTGHAALAEHRRTLDLADRGVCVAAVPEASALVRSPDGAWRSDGAEPAAVFVDGEQVGLDALPG